MGLFSSKKTIVVSSTVYNMAGPEVDRPNFMKSTIFANVMNPNGGFLGEGLVQAYLGGPGINQRLLFNYAVRTNFPGLPTYSINKSIAVNPEVVRPYISVTGLEEAVIQDCDLINGDYEVFAEIYMNANYPNEINEDWVAEYNKNDHTITIQREGGGTVTFGAGAYDPNGRFVIANYYKMIPSEDQAVVPGTLVSNVLAGSLPSVSGFTLVSTTNTGVVTYTQNQTRVITKTYSNGDPTIVTTDYPVITTNFDTILKRYEKTVYDGGDGESPQLESTKTIRYIWEKRQVYTSSSSSSVTVAWGGGGTETTVTAITGDFLRPIYDHRTDTQTIIETKVTSGNETFVYKVGTGNAVLDALNVGVGSAVTAEFYPFIPMRLNNKSITEPEFATIYDKSKKLYKRATKKEKLEDLVEEIEANPDLDEIDYAFLQWGITLNTYEDEALKYMYTFWKNLQALHGLPSNYITTFNSSKTTYETQMATYNAWVAAQAVPASPLYGDPAPTLPSFGSPKTMTLQFKTTDPTLDDYDTRLTFSFSDEITGVGLGRPGAMAGDLWTAKDTEITWTTSTGVKGLLSFGGSGEFSKPRTKTNKMKVFRLYWQTSPTAFKYLRIYGAVHENFIYGGKSVRINSDEALDDADDSGFLIPLHYPSVKEAGLVSSTQLATANTYLVFNSYQVFKKKWYETFLGMLFIIIVVVVAAAIIAPGAVGGISGIFGTNAAVGTGLGLSGTAGIVAGAVANAIAAVLLSTALSYGSTALFGEKWGALIGSLLSFAISFGMAGGFNNLASLFQPKNLLALSSALANGYKGFVAGSITEMNAELVKIGEETNKELKRMQNLMDDLMGNALAFDPMSLTDATEGNESGTGNYLPESLEEFIQRTTLTGSDIVDMTLSIVRDFSELSLTLPKT